MQRATPKRLIDARELSQLLSVKVSTIYKWVHEGKIPHYKLGRLVRFSEREVMDWVDNQRSRRSAGRAGKL